jgi:hypothetical protein
MHCSTLDKVENKLKNVETEMTEIKNEITKSVKKTEEIMVKTSIRESLGYVWYDGYVKSSIKIVTKVKRYIYTKYV